MPAILEIDPSRERPSSMGSLGQFRSLRRGNSELVTMENVPELAGRGREVFDRFLAKLEKFEYKVDWKIVECPKYGIPQSRRRLVLLASRLGKIVSQVIVSLSIPVEIGEGHDRRLPKLEAGEEAADDRLHAASLLSK